VPQARGIDFYPSALEKGARSERALKLAVAEMYVQGVSTRKVAAITEKRGRPQTGCEAHAFLLGSGWCLAVDRPKTNALLWQPLSAWDLEDRF
jgi:hypothetical protein